VKVKVKIWTDSKLLKETKMFVLEYKKEISETFTSEILAIRSALKNDIKPLNSIRKLSQLLILKTII